MRICSSWSDGSRDFAAAETYWGLRCPVLAHAICNIVYRVSEETELSIVCYILIRFYLIWILLLWRGPNTAATFVAVYALFGPTFPGTYNKKRSIYTLFYPVSDLSHSFDSFSGKRRLILTLLFYFTGFVIRFPNPGAVHRVLPASGRSVAKGLYFNISLRDQYRALIQQPNPSVLN